MQHLDSRPTDNEGTPVVRLRRACFAGLISDGSSHVKPTDARAESLEMSSDTTMWFTTPHQKMTAKSSYGPNMYATMRLLDPFIPMYVRIFTSKLTLKHNLRARKYDISKLVPALTGKPPPPQYGGQKLP